MGIKRNFSLFHDCIDVAAWLLQSNADAELENKDKQTPLDLIPEHNKQMKTYIQKLIQG